MRAVLVMDVIGKGVLRKILLCAIALPAPPPPPQAPSPNADAFLHYRTSKFRALRAARLERLVWELVYGDPQQDPSFVPAFLATHQAFVPTDRVLDLLLPPPPPPLPSWSVPVGNLVFPPQTLTQGPLRFRTGKVPTPDPAS